MLFIFWGKDAFSIEEALQEVKGSLGDMSLLSTNTTSLDGQKLTVKELKAVVETVPFLAPARLVIVKGLLDRFEPKSAAAQPKKSKSSSAKQDDSQMLAECIRAMPESTVLVLIDTIENSKKPLQNNPLYNAIADKATVRAFPILKGARLTQWVQNRVNRMGGSISQQATGILTDTIGGDLFTLSNEINKLVAFTAGRMIEEKDVRLLVAASREVEVFTLIDAIIDRKTAVAAQILQTILQGGAAPPQILVLLARQVEILVRIKDLRNRRRPVAEIQAKVGIFNPYAWERVSKRADRYTLDALKDFYRRLLETDLAIKTGRLEGDLAVNILIADLSLSH